MEVRKLSEEEKKPQKILFEVTIPTKESLLDGIKRMFPTVEVKVVEEEKKESELVEIAARYKAGEQVDEILKDYPGIPKSSVYYHFKKMGIEQ